MHPRVRSQYILKGHQTHFGCVGGNDVEGNDGSPIWRHGSRFDTVYDGYSTMGLPSLESPPKVVWRSYLY
jgi:hypothetical protein